MQLESKKYLYDIAQAAGRAQQVIEGKNYSEYASDPLLRWAVERQLQIVGEALAQLSRKDPTTAARISEYKQIIAFRNILVHGYAKIDNQVVWSVLRLKLPLVLREAELLLAEG